MKRLLAAALILAGCSSARMPPMIDAAQGRLHISDGGRGEGLPVLLVHGNGGNLTQWQAQLAHLRKTRRAVAFDLRGMGLSQIPVNGDYSIEGMVEDVQAVADSLGLNRFVIVGHSYSGTVVAAYAAQHPERVAGVVYADATGDLKGTPEAIDRYLDALRADKPRVLRMAYEPVLANSSDAVKAAVLMSADRTPVEAFVGAFEGWRVFNVAKALAAYTGPKFAIVAAGNNQPTSFHVQFPHVPRREIEGVGHWLMMDKPQEFNRLLDEFLARVR